MNCNTAAAICDDLSREVYCILGIPIDAIEMPAVLCSIDTAVANASPFFISTPNLNFLVTSQTDPEFRESLLLSDLCPPDGMPIIWIARIFGVPIKRRIAGSDIFEALKSRPGPGLKVFLFGATEPVAAAASKRLNHKSIGLNCVGWACPGFGSVDDLSQDQFINQINSSKADFLVAALGAKKGQLWLLRNHHQLQIPIRSHLGATINFQAGLVSRAPYAMQKLGLEWLWRIKEEPYLWRRYWHDGRALLRLLLARALPLAIGARWLQLRAGRGSHRLVVVQVQSDHVMTLRLAGYATATHVSNAIACFREAIASRKQVVVDFSETRAADARFLGLLLMLRKQLNDRGTVLKFVGVSPQLERHLRRNGLGYLLSSGKDHDINARH